MKSTARILQITDKYGKDRKRQLHRDLIELRHEVKQEILYHIHYGITQAKQRYMKEIKPGHKINN